MTARITGRPVLVGVDGSAASLVAVDLAVREACLRQRPVRVLHADAWASHPAWVDTDPRGSVAEDLAADPEWIVRSGADRARAAGAVEVSSEVLPGSPSAVLIRESAGAELVVVGHRGRGGFPGLLLGSVAANVSAHAHCPTLVAREPIPSGGPVVVGVDGSPAGEPAIGFAFQEAVLRSAVLLAVHSWTGPDITGPTDLLLYDPVGDEDAHARLLARALAPWQTKYPQVTVQRRVRWDRPGHALAEASEGAQLVVVGARGHGVLPGLRLGSVTHALLHHARCPVATVRAPG